MYSYEYLEYFSEFAFIIQKNLGDVRIISVPLTLIGLGEVKVDLADFDLKLQENLLSIFLYTYSCKNVFRIFLNFWHYLK